MLKTTELLDRQIAELTKIRNLASIVEEIILHMDPYKLTIDLPVILHQKLLGLTGFDDSE